MSSIKRETREVRREEIARVPLQEISQNSEDEGL